MSPSNPSYYLALQTAAERQNFIYDMLNDVEILRHVMHTLRTGHPQICTVCKQPFLSLQRKGLYCGLQCARQAYTDRKTANAVSKGEKHAPRSMSLPLSLPGSGPGRLRGPRP